MDSDDEACKKFKTCLNDCFQMKDLGPLKYFLGIEVARNSQGLFLSQRKYALEIIDECGLLESKPTNFPMETNHKLALSDSKPLRDAAQYRRLIGKLIYLTITHPKLAYAVHILSQFMQEPKAAHMDAAKQVLRYLKGCSGRRLLLRSDCDLQLYAYCDSDLGACPLT